MFPAPHHLPGGGSRPAAGHRRQPATDLTSRSGAILRLACLTSLLLAATSGRASAQAIGTMQATARVLPAGPSWAGLEEARAAALAVLREASADAGNRRTRLVRTHAELQAEGRRQRLVITLHHPHN